MRRKTGLLVIWYYGAIKYTENSCSWCILTEDEVHMDSSELNEYILNESTGVYRGSSWNFRGVAWDLGQVMSSNFFHSIYLLFLSKL